MALQRDKRKIFGVQVAFFAKLDNILLYTSRESRSIITGKLEA